MEPATCVTRQHVALLWQKAKDVGFTAESIRRLLILLNLDPKNMSVRDFATLMPFVNALNAKKFNY